MPSYIMKRSVLRVRASVTVGGQTQQKLFPDDSLKSYKRAVAWEEGIRGQMSADLIVSSAGFVSISAWVQQHLDDVKTHCVRKTYKEKKAALKKIITYTGLRPEASVAEIIPFARSFLIEHAEVNKGSSANKIRKNLARAWGFGAEVFKEKWPNCRNPFAAVDKFPADQKPRYVPSEDDFLKVVLRASKQDQLMLLTYYYTAARRSELFKLRWLDIDFDKRMLRLGTRKKGGGLRNDWMPLPESLCGELKNWRLEQASVLGHLQEFVFVCLEKTPLSDMQYGKPYTVRQHFMRTMCQLSEVVPFGYHGIRHLVAQKWYRMKKSLGFIQRYLRHQHATTTEFYLRSLGCEDIRKGLDGMMLPSLDQLKQDQGRLLVSGFDQVLKGGEDKVNVISLKHPVVKRKGA